MVAEGIENAQQCAVLHAAGVGYGQGFHFARPAPAAEIADLLSRTTQHAGGVTHAGGHGAR
jgi:EAL domain-containing protein (putative c-di-GMP-specific phosphodiesterase class I)